jgi:hypothetical protein
MHLLRLLTFPATRRSSARLWSSRRREILTMLAFVVADITAAELRALPFQPDVPVQAGRPVAFDRWLGFGTTPTERLQSWFPAGLHGWFAWCMLAVHISWFVIPGFLTVYVIVRRPGDVWSYAIARTGILFVAAVFFALLPTEPPWMTLHITRVLEIGGKAPVNADWNTLAAFPSLHVAVPAVQAMWLWSKRMRRLAGAFTAFTLLTAFMAVYTGEHYVIDAIGAAALAYVMVRVATLNSLVAREGSSHNDLLSSIPCNVNEIR